MIGQAQGSMVATEDLVVGVEVLVDHERFQVTALRFGARKAVVTLTPMFGHDWDLEVAREDLEEPIWEVA